MPQVGWVFNETQKVLYEDALDWADQQGDYEGWPYEILRGMYEQNTKERPDGITVTTLLSNPRHIQLEKEHDYFEDPGANYSRFRGSIVHTIMEQYGSVHSTVEQRIVREYQSVPISGQPDTLQIRSSNGRTLLRDWKTTKELPYYDNAYSSHQRQVNLYRWLLELDPAECDLEIVYISMAGIKTIPLKHGGKSRNGRKIAEQHLSDAEVEAFIDQRLQLFDKRPILRYNDIPDEDRWLCKFSPIENICRRLAWKEAREDWLAGKTDGILPPVGEETL